MTCFPCTHESTEPYDYNSMAFFAHWERLCDSCLEKFKAMKPPVETYKLRPALEPEPKKAWTPKQVAVRPDFNERPDNRGELME